MLFHYTASTPEGKIIEGEGEFENRQAILDFLKNQNLTPIKVEALVAYKKRLRGGIFSSPISLTDKIFLTRYLALMLRVGTDIFKAIDILIADFEKPALKALLMEIRQNLEKGNPFYLTFQKYPRIFSSVFTNMIKAGESSGNLEQVFSDLSVSLEKERELKQRLRSALIYPILLVGVSIAILFLLVSFAIPRISSMFLESGMKIPTITKIIFNVSTFLSQYGLILLGFFLIFVFVLFLFFRGSLLGRKVFQRIIFNIPLVKEILKKMAYQRFATTFGSLMRAGLPIVENLEITAETVGNEEMRQALLRIAHEGVMRGVPLGEAFHKEEIFPQTIRTLIAIGEKAGHTEEVLKNLADFYETEIDTSVKSLVALFEPLMLMIIGVVVGAIALAVILPVYQFISQMSVEQQQPLQ